MMGRLGGTLLTDAVVPGDGSGFTLISQTRGSEVAVNWDQAQGRECTAMALGTPSGEGGRRSLP